MVARREDLTPEQERRGQAYAETFEVTRRKLRDPAVRRRIKATLADLASSPTRPTMTGDEFIKRVKRDFRNSK
jgi:hypothetical protein